NHTHRSPTSDRYVDAVFDRPDGSATLTFLSFRPNEGQRVDLSQFYSDSLAARRTEPGFKLVDEPPVAAARAFHAVVKTDGRESEETLWIKADDDRVYLARLVGPRGPVFARDWEQ